MEAITDPKIFGPGMWYSIHVSSLQLGENNYITYVEALLNKLPCKKCRDHAMEYLRDNPIENFKSIKDKDGELIGMFKWSWMFHNAVNKRLNKQIIDFNTAYNFYTGAEALCTLNCGN